MDEQALLDTGRALANSHPERLSNLSAAILVTLVLEQCRSSRAFARRFGVAHALVIRECVELSSGEDALLRILSRDERTQRLTYALGDAGIDLMTDIGEKHPS